MTPPTYTPLSRAGFEKVGIKSDICQLCHGTGASGDRQIVGECQGCHGDGHTGPSLIDITGVLANWPPARTQADVEAAVEWLGDFMWPEHRDDLPFGMAKFIEIHTRLLVVEPREGIVLSCQCVVCGAYRNNFQDARFDCDEDGDSGFDGLIIVGGDVPLNPDHVAHLIEQAESAGVPVWLWWGKWLPDLGFPFSQPRQALDIGGVIQEYRQLPAAMGGV